MSRCFLLPFAGAVSIALWWLHAPLASAQPNDGRGSANAPAGEKVSLRYGGVSECPDAATFRAAVAQRLSGNWEASPGELARRIDIVVSRVEDGYVATIELLDADGRRLRRAVRGRNCGDVVNGIALVTVLAIEARLDEAVESSEPVMAAGSTPEPSSNSVPNSMPPAAPPSGPAGAASVGATQPSAPVVVAPVASSGVPPEGSASASEGASTPLGWRAGLRAGVMTGIGPRVAPGLSLAGTLELGAARFGLAFLGFSSGRVTASGVEARFDLVTSRLEGCPSAIELGSSMGLELCASFDAGVLSGRGYSDPPTVAEGQSGLSPWLAPGAVARLVGSFGQLVVEFEGGARFPLRREEFFVDSGEGAGDTRTSVYEVPATSLGAALGLGLHF